MKRRTFLKSGIFGSIGLGMLPNSYLLGRDCVASHPDILGPYWSENHPERSVLANSEEPGVRIFMSGTVTSKDCETPIQNAIVDVWHANDDGCYTVFQECESGNTDNDLYNLRGIIVTDENGSYAFESILPGYYAGRPRHFHYKITTPSGLELVTQCYFEMDPYVDEQWEENHPGLVIPLQETEDGQIGVFDIIMDEEVIEVGVDSVANSSSSEFSLDTVYPNPFNNSTRIDFFINNSGYVEIGIYDIMGRWITNLVGEYMQSGKHSISWSGIDISGKPLSSGTYMIVMKFGNKFQTKRTKFIK